MSLEDSKKLKEIIRNLEIETQCPVCLEPIENPINCDPCNHSFCFAHLDKLKLDL